MMMTCVSDDFVRDDCVSDDCVSNERFVNAFADRLTDVIISAKL